MCKSNFAPGKSRCKFTPGYKFAHMYIYICIYAITFTCSNLHPGSDYAYMQNLHPMSKSAHVNGAFRFHLLRQNLSAFLCVVVVPLCSCGSVENTEHCLLHCPKYNDIRWTTIHTLTDYMDVYIALLLNGLPYLDARKKSNVFEMVHTFISGSKIFT